MDETKQQTIQFRDIIKELGLEGLPIEKQAELIERMSKLIYKRILLRIVDRLSENETEELNVLLDKENYEKADEYIRDRAPDFVSLFKEEVEKFQSEMMGKIKERLT